MTPVLSEATHVHDSVHQDRHDPLRAKEIFAHREVFYPLGFAVEIETNSREVLLAAHESWREQTSLGKPSARSAPLKLRLGVSHSNRSECPPATDVRAFGHLLSIVADAENYAVCDLQKGFAFGWINEATLRHRSYLRYHFLEAAVMCLIAGSRVTPVHAACVTYNGRGLLLCGASGAGKSTLAYACARAGFAFTTDDASYVVWQSGASLVRGNAHQVRFRPAARELFPELQDRTHTPRTTGKPSIEIRTAELDIVKAPEASIHAILILNRRVGAEVELLRLSLKDVLPHLEEVLFPLDGIREQQVIGLQQLLDVEMYELRYSDLGAAVDRLRQLTLAMTNR